MLSTIAADDGRPGRLLAEEALTGAPFVQYVVPGDAVEDGTARIAEDPTLSKSATAAAAFYRTKELQIPIPEGLAARVSPLPAADSLVDLGGATRTAILTDSVTLFLRVIQRGGGELWG
jgi:hypothetical protein